MENTIQDIKTEINLIYQNLRQQKEDLLPLKEEKKKKRTIVIPSYSFDSSNLIMLSKKLIKEVLENLESNNNLKLSYSSLDLIGVLDDLGFFNKPAAIKHHHNIQSGLVLHSLEVAIILYDLVCASNSLMIDKISPIESLFVGIFHDLCKCDDYYFNESLNEYKTSYYQRFSGHGSKSNKMLIQMGITNYSREVDCAIEQHMGIWGSEIEYNKYSKEYSLVPLTHTADMLSTNNYNSL